jgi:hypothetical protein
MKSKPSDYQKTRWLKKDNIPEGGSVFTVTDFDEVNKSDRTDKEDFRIRLTFDERWWFELAGNNLDTTIDLLGDDFANWDGKQIGLCLAAFTNKNGETNTYIKVVSAPEIKKRPTLKRRTKPENGEPARQGDEREIPF